MSAPTITELPALPTFPAGPGLPDQPGVFIPQFLAFLEALRNWRGDLNAFAAYLEELSGGITTVSATGFRPLVDGSDPPVFIITTDHELIMAEM
jgi:hypothetical protein